jgi:predicted MPP superfamily phosphohydrolase
VVQLSDLHAGPIVDQNYLLQTVAGVARLSTDMIVLTGDFMTCEGTEQIDRALEVAAAVPHAPLGRFAVMGNHDYASGRTRPDVADRLAQGLEDAGIRVLRNEVASIGDLQILGVDDLWTPNFDPLRALEELGSDQPVIALCHNPDGVDDARWSGFEGWILAGHTHGGQCTPPWFGPPVLPVRNRRYTAGEFDLHDGRRLYINRGVGYLRRVRFNCRPEVTLFELTREA